MFFQIFDVHSCSLVRLHFAAGCDDRCGCSGDANGFRFCRNQVFPRGRSGFDTQLSLPLVFIVDGAGKHRTGEMNFALCLFELASALGQYPRASFRAHLLSQCLFLTPLISLWGIRTALMRTTGLTPSVGLSVPSCERMPPVVALCACACDPAVMARVCTQAQRTCNSPLTGTGLRPLHENAARAKTPHAHESPDTAPGQNLFGLHQKRKSQSSWFGCRKDKKTSGVYFSED